MHIRTEQLLEVTEARIPGHLSIKKEIAPHILEHQIGTETLFKRGTINVDKQCH